MNVSLLRLVCLGLFLFAVTSVTLADSARDGYVFKVSYSTDPSLFFNVKSLSNGCQEVAYVVSGFLNSARLQNHLHSYAGGCPSGSGLANGQTLQFIWDDLSYSTYWVISEISPPSEPGTISDYSTQDILVMGFAFLAFCLGWMVGR